MISVIVPMHNEEKILTSNSRHFKNLSESTELIFVDGESSDKSAEIASIYGKVLSSKKGRAIQMNYGAKEARNDVLLFLHADTFILPKTIECIQNKISQGEVIGGCLTQRINKTGLLYRLIESFGSIRAAATRVFYGDQGIFIKKDVFLKMNGFPEKPVMEDVLFTKKLRKLGKTAILQDKIFTSARRWEKRGIISTVFLYSLLNLMFWFNAPLEKVKLLYDDLR